MASAGIIPPKTTLYNGLTPAEVYKTQVLIDKLKCQSKLVVLWFGAMPVMVSMVVVMMAD